MGEMYCPSFSPWYDALRRWVFSPADFADKDSVAQRGGLGCPRSWAGNGSHGPRAQGSTASKPRKKQWEVYELNLRFRDFDPYFSTIPFLWLPSRTPEAPVGAGSHSRAALDPQPRTSPAQLGPPCTGPAWRACAGLPPREAQGWHCSRRLPLPQSQATEGQPGACPVSPAPSGQRPFPPAQGPGQESVPHTLLQEAVSHAPLRQRHLCPWGHGP